MALSNRINFRGGQSVSGKTYLYNNGTWGVGYDNPGGYSYTGASIQGATLNPNNVSMDGTTTKATCIGTSQKIDLSDKSMIKLKAKKSGGGTASIIVASDKVLSTPSHITRITQINVTPDYTEFALDVSDLTGNFYVCIYLSEYVQNVTFNELWIE